MILRLIIVCIFSVSFFFSKSNEKNLLEADSLFANQKYTEAFQVYESIFYEGIYTESMLLKMAFIKDGLGNYVDALFYLDLYYKNSGDKSVVSKIEEISAEKDLVGYSYNDSHIFKALLNKYSLQLQLALMSITLFLAVYIYRKRKQQERPVTASIFQLLVLGAILILSNNGFQNTYGIINQSNTLLRNGPSAGAEPVAFIDKGHKVQIIKRSDVWTKINWQGEEVFLRNGKIKII
jgi:hypothetical protein